MRDKSQESGTDARQAELIATGFATVGRALISMGYSSQVTAAGQDLLVIAGRIAGLGERSGIATIDVAAMLDAIGEQIRDRKSVV